MLHNLHRSSVWYHIKLTGFFVVPHSFIYNIVKTNFKKGFHEFVLTILLLSLFNTLMDLSYSTFVSKLFISNESLILRSCILDNFASVFGCSQLNRPWQYLEYSVAPDASHFLAMLSSWCSTDRVSTRSFVSPMYSRPQSQLNS